MMTTTVTFSDALLKVKEKLISFYKLPQSLENGFLIDLAEKKRRLIGLQVEGSCVGFAVFGMTVLDSTSAGSISVSL